MASLNAAPPRTVPRGTRISPARALRGPPKRLLGRSNRIRDNAASTMAAQIERWMIRFARFEAEQAIASMRQSAIAMTLLKREAQPGRINKTHGYASPRLFGSELSKAAGLGELIRQLQRILARNGEAQIQRTVRRVTGQKTARPTDVAMREFYRQKEVLLQQIISTSRREVRESVRDLIGRSLAEVPRPSAGEVARRIRTSFHNSLAAGDTYLDIVPDPMPPERPRVLPTQRYRLTDGGSLHVFSSERAALIARTELTQAENTGIVDAYEQTGVLGLEWLAYEDGRSGDRQHNELNGVAVPRGGLFRTPLGNLMRYPGDPRAPIKELANCRCSVRGIYDPEELERKLQKRNGGVL